MSDLKILFEDDSLIVVNKPAGLVSTPSDTSSEPTLADILNQEHGVKLDRGGLVHRLDKDTSGIILAAKTQQAFDNLQQQFQDRTVKKEYQALIHGTMSEPVKVDAPIDRNPGDREKFTVIEGGREAVTEFSPIKQLTITNEQLTELFPDFSKIQMKKLSTIHYPLFTLVACRPLTGRTHQIRVHLKYINLSLVGDDKYGGRKVVRLDHRWCPRQFLHAAKISFSHPATGQLMSLEAPLPEDLEKALSFLTAHE
jgi:23S rRNA pseudouridine1911/1915/1917 synthase